MSRTFRHSEFVPRLSWRVSTFPARRVKLLDSLPAPLVFASRRSRVQLTMPEPVDTRGETGRMTLPIPEPWLTWLRDLRQGRHTKDEALAAADELEAKLEKLITSSPLPERPDRALANAWLQQAYQRVWSNPITR